MKFVIATHNKGKLAEFQRLLEPMGIQAVTMDISEPEETGKTFAENAYIKAAAACQETGLPAVADDSGLCVDYLEGAPGIYSARFAQPGQRRLTVLEKLKDVPWDQRDAHFVSAVCCVFPNGDRVEAEGKCFGKIAYESRGENGFGYDSIFQQGELTFGELSAAEKDARSHRGHAFAAFEEKLKAYLAKGEPTPCGLDCAQCPGRKNDCPGCGELAKGCVVAQCAHQKNSDPCASCRPFEGPCALKAQLIREFNALGIKDMEEVTDLNALAGSYVNLAYTLPGGQKVTLWDDGRVYLGSQLHKRGSDRCYGLTADERYLMVAEYGDNGADPELVVFKRREKPGSQQTEK